MVKVISAQISKIGRCERCKKHLSPKKMGRKIQIGIIDSGIDKDYLNRQETKIIKEFSIFDDFNDNIGHGTAVTSVIVNELSDVEIYIIKAFDTCRNTNEEDLTTVLHYIEQNVKVDILILSCGMTMLSYKATLYKICDNLKEKGTIIISAFDNEGVVSYPAAFENVIGVAINEYYRKIYEYEYVENSPINVIGYGGTLFLPWKNCEYRNVAGSSFVTPYIAVILARKMKNNKLSYEEALGYLKTNAKRISCYEDNQKKKYQIIIKNKIKEIKKAITFPVSKEMHSVLGNVDLLGFQIEAAYDLPQFGRVGKSVSEYVYGTNVFDGNISDYNKIDWKSNFDTFILGHTRNLEAVLKKDYIEEIMSNCIKYEKNIYCFDVLDKYEKSVNDLENIGRHAIWFDNRKINAQIQNNGILYQLNNPVIAVLGTNSKQGKFNIQLDLRRKFINDGYTVAQLGTEPTSWLLGMDIEYANGYESTYGISIDHALSYLNYELSLFDERDVIITGMQSNTIPYGFGNLRFYTFEQQMILCAAVPDVVILAVNIDDEYDYVKRTICYLQSYFEVKYIAICLFPGKRDKTKQGYTSNGINVIEIRKQELFEKLELPIFVNGNYEDMKLLYKFCLNCFV